MYLKFTHIFLTAFVMMLILPKSESVDLTIVPNGYFITGEGCGISSPIRYLNEVPEILGDHKCSFIQSRVANSNPWNEDHKKVFIPKYSP